MSLLVLETRGIFLQVYTSNRKRRETSCKLTPPLSSCEYEGFLSQLVPSTENHRRCTRQMFTSSQIQFLCMGKGPMNILNAKNTERWNAYVEQHRGTARRIDGEQIQIVFHIFLGDKTNEIVREIDGWISTEPMRRWTTFYSRNLSSSNSFHRNDE